MENLLEHSKGVAVFLDDILVTGPITQEHLQALEAVLKCLQDANLYLRKDKCSFLNTRVEYLDAEGLHPTDDKTSAIRDAPAPQNVTQLRSFLGILNYYSKFLPNLATTLQPLYQLLAKGKRWEWTRRQEEAFKTAKQALQSDAVLVHYDSSKPLVLACDASEYGVGAVLSHILDNGQEKPVAFASRTLNPAERRYSQLEREGLAIIFGVKKFHYYLYGCTFTIESDHQPLSHIFSPSKSWHRGESSDGP